MDEYLQLRLRENHIKFITNMLSDETRVKLLNAPSVSLTSDNYFKRRFVDTVMMTSSVPRLRDDVLDKIMRKCNEFLTPDLSEEVSETFEYASLGSVKITSSCTDDTVSFKTFTHVGNQYTTREGEIDIATLKYLYRRFCK